MDYRPFVWSHGETPMVKSWCASWPRSSLVAWYVAAICFLECRKWKSRACFKHIWSVFIFNNSQWVFMCLNLPIEAEFLTHRLVFFQLLHPTLEKWDEEQWKHQQAWYQPGGKVDFYPWRWPMALAIHMKLILTLEKFQYHLWHRFTQDEERLTLLGWGRFFHGTARLSACSGH